MDEKLSCDFYVSLKGPKCLDFIWRPSQISHEKDFKAWQGGGNLCQAEMLSGCCGKSCKNAADEPR